jgi:hypothetical protein
MRQPGQATKSHPGRADRAGSSQREARQCVGPSEPPERRANRASALAVRSVGA